MSHWLYFPPQSLIGSSGFESVRYGRDDTILSEGPLSDAAQAFGGQPVQVVLPMEACSWFRSPPWPTRRKPSSRALAYSIEEQLAEDVDALHVAVGQPDTQRRYPMMIIAKTLLREVLGSLRAARVCVERVCIDADLLCDDQPVGVCSEGRWLLGGALEARLALTDTALDVLRSHLPGDIVWRQAEEGELSVLFGLRKTRAIDLLQGEFRVVHRSWQWRPLLLALAGILCLTWGFSAARIHYLETRADALYAQSLQRFKTLYPEQTRIVDLPAQFKALQTQGAQKQGPMSTLSALAAQVLDEGIEVQHADFDVAQGWKLMITAASFSALERVREKAEKQGLPIRLDSASQTRDGVRAVLSLQDGVQ